MPDLVDRLRAVAERWRQTLGDDAHIALLLEAAHEIEFVRAAYTGLLRQWDHAAQRLTAIPKEEDTRA